VRSMALITVFIQPHVIRETDGSSPTWSPDEINAVINETNTIWAQAGIRFQTRPLLFIDNTALRSVSVTETKRQFHNDFPWFSSDDLDQMVAWDRAHAPTPATDPLVIHMYFFESLDFREATPNAKTEVKAFAGGGIGGNWVAVPRGAPKGA